MKQIAATILILLSIVSCQQRNKGNDNSSADSALIKNKRDSLSSASTLTVVDIGNLYLPTGKIVAGDPFFVSDESAFTKTVAQGTYPVKLIIDKIEDDHYRIAFARIEFNKQPVVRWEMAFTTSFRKTDLDSLKDDDIVGYGVDAGMGCFTDEESNRMYTKEMDDFYTNHTNGNFYDNVLADEMEKASGTHPLSRDLGDWCNHVLKDGKHNVIIFASGWGDGLYASYWGYDRNGEIAALITDFQVADFDPKKGKEILPR